MLRKGKPPRELDLQCSRGKQGDAGVAKAEPNLRPNRIWIGGYPVDDEQTAEPTLDHVLHVAAEIDGPVHAPRN